MDLAGRHREYRNFGPGSLRSNIHLYADNKRELRCASGAGVQRQYSDVGRRVDILHYILTGLTPAASYWFAIKAFDGANWSVWNSSGDAASVNTLAKRLCHRRSDTAVGGVESYGVTRDREREHIIEMDLAGR